MIRGHHRHKWDDDDLIYLRANYGKIKTAKIADHLNREVSGVQQQARLQGLKQSFGRDLSIQIRDVVVKNPLIKLNEIGDELNVDPTVVTRTIRYHMRISMHQLRLDALNDHWQRKLDQ